MSKMTATMGKYAIASFLSIPHLFKPSSDVTTRQLAASETLEQSNTLKLSTKNFPFGSVSPRASKSSTVL